MDLNSSDGQTVYLIHTKYSDNKNLFSKMIEKRDDGSITIGSLFAILTPHAIVSRYSNGVPMLTCNGGMILCNTPHNLRIVPIANSLPSNITVAFSFYGKIEVTGVDVVETKCNGFLCDRQNVFELQKDPDKGCGCFAMADRSSNMVISLNLIISHNKNKLQVDNFCSHSFTNYFIDIPFPSSVKWRQFDNTTEYEDLMDRVIAIAKWINDDCGGWLICGLSKKGEIKDQTFKSDTTDDNKVDSGKINHHVTKIFARYPDKMNAAKLLGYQFKMDDVTS